MVKNNKILVSLLFFFLIALPGRSQTTQSLEKKIEAIQKDIKLAEKLLKETSKDKEVTLNQVALMQTQIKQRETLINTYQNKVNLINKEIQKNKNEIASLRKDLALYQKEYSNLLVINYRNKGKANNLLFIFSSEDFNQAMRRMRYIQELNGLVKDKIAEIDSTQTKINAQLQKNEKHKREVEKVLNDEKNRKLFEVYSVDYEYKMVQKAHWETLDKMFGSKDGDKLMKCAQEYTLDILLGVANEHLADMTKRYRLARVSDTGMDIKVIDLDMMSESRSANTLSGGETFIVSLALSLALSSLSSNRMKIESLFIDEGFGALDKEILQTALMMLEKLQSCGRKVGVISHLGEMLEQIPVKVNVVGLSPGRSKVEITGNKH